MHISPMRNFYISLTGSHLQEVFIHDEMNSFLFETVWCDIFIVLIDTCVTVTGSDLSLEISNGVWHCWDGLSPENDLLIILKVS